MLERLEKFTLPENVRKTLDRGVLAIGTLAFASGIVGNLL